MVLRVFWRRAGKYERQQLVEIFKDFGEVEQVVARLGEEGRDEAEEVVGGRGAELGDPVVVGVVVGGVSRHLYKIIKL